MSKKVSAKDPTHATHVMAKSRRTDDEQLRLNNHCNACGARMWGSAGDWNNDTALEVPCKKAAP